MREEQKEEGIYPEVCPQPEQNKAGSVQLAPYGTIPVIAISPVWQNHPTLCSVFCLSCKHFTLTVLSNYPARYLTLSLSSSPSLIPLYLLPLFLSFSVSFSFHVSFSFSVSVSLSPGIMEKSSGDTLFPVPESQSLPVLYGDILLTSDVTDAIGGLPDAGRRGVIGQLSSWPLPILECVCECVCTCERVYVLYVQMRICLRIKV